MFTNEAQATGISISCLSKKYITLAFVQGTYLAVFEQDQN